MKTHLLMISAALLSLHAMAADDSSPSFGLLRCEGLVSPNLVETSAPRFSWQLKSPQRGASQKAYQLRINGLDTAGEPHETARIESDQSQWVELPNFSAKPKTRYSWQVRVWDQENHPSEWSPPATFETSLLGSPWQAEWISDGKVIPNGDAPPARYFRKSFDLPSPPIRAKLYLSAFGIVQPWLNGQKVTTDHFLPGWPDYTKRNFYVAYDVTRSLKSGKNALGLVLGDGWYSGRMWPKNQYGPTPKVSGWLEITDSSGKTTCIPTDSSWTTATGPILANGIYFGETYDARKENAAWSQASGGDWTWSPVKVEPPASVPLVARHSQPVRATEERQPISHRQISPGVQVYDLGQNMVGWVRLKVKASAGQEIHLRFAEMLNADGTIYVGNLRKAKATALYTAKGEGTEIWEPSFTFFGFRYVEISGVEAPLQDAITGIVVHSDLPRIGHFECSNPLLNQLYSNTLWGQKGNFLELPTDCPQRDERVGWTGDAQVFCHTANYNMDCGAFYRQWSAALRDSFKEGKDGGYGDVAPVTGGKPGSAGWGDAGVIIPWVTYLHSGDRRILEDNFETAQRWIDQQEQFNPDFIRRSKPSYGDWLAPGYPAAKAPTPYVLIATAYFAHSTQLVAQMAQVLGKPEIAAKNLALFEKIKAAFQKEFITADGKITSDAQTAYLLALGFDLVSKELRPQMAQHLAAAFAAKADHLATGFIGTPLITPVLTEVGLSDLAYKVVLQETYPGWLFSVKNGATTIWERWDSWTAEKGFSKDGMNSFNHYAYGSVCGWFYDTIAGLKPDANAAGWKHFEISPTPGGGLTSAKASLETPYGLAASEWSIDGAKFLLRITIPANTRATVRIPAASVESITCEGKPLSTLGKAEFSSGRASILLGAGTYEFLVN
jgi:alpha-L-rhamnosidase